MASVSKAFAVDLPDVRGIEGNKKSSLGFVYLFTNISEVAAKDSGPLSRMSKSIVQSQNQRMGLGDSCSIIQAGRSAGCGDALHEAAKEASCAFAQPPEDKGLVFCVESPRNIGSRT